MSSRLPPQKAKDGQQTRRRAAASADTVVRLRAASAVVVFVVGALVAGSVVRASNPPPVATSQAGRLPVVDLRSTDSVDWQCPGPLPAGTQRARSSVVVVNPSGQPTTVQVDIASVRARSGTAALPAVESRLAVGADREAVMTLPTSGPASDDAVSVLSPTGSVAVFESVSRPASAGGRGKGAKNARAAAAPLQSPCATGATSTSYIASGSTAGRSAVAVSLFNPTATPAVAAISVATPAGVTAPPMLQGVIVQPYSVQVFALGRSVVQQPTLAVTETTSAGRLVFGALESVESDVTAATSIRGGGLAVGVASPEETWTMTPGLELTGRTVSVRIFDPGSRAASVTVTCPVTGKPAIELTSTVAAGRVRDLELPFAALAPSRTGAPAALPAGPITVRSAQGVGVVVSRQTVEQTGLHAETVAVLSPSARAATAWVLPVSAAPAVLGSGVTAAGGIVVANDGAQPAVVQVVQLPASGSANLSRLRTFSLAPGVTSAVGLRLPPKSGAATAGIEVLASSPVLVEGDFYALGTAQLPVSILPLPVEGIPVER